MSQFQKSVIMTGDLALQLWKEWGLQTLVLLSFTLQVVLLILAEFRRSMDSGVLRAFLWPAYMLADSTATFVLGHLSVASRSPEHQLMAFWAPFLLLHLGGQDSITAYAIEDNELWLRHLQTLTVQVAAAAYVLYESFIIGSEPSLLLPAGIIMFAVGASNVERGCGRSSAPVAAHLAELYKVTEMQLSLMHDVFYTKAELVHTWSSAQEELGWSVTDIEFDDSIIIWHIATGTYLYYWYQKQAKDSGRQDDGQLLAHAKAAEGLSNYMLFLLAARPYMLPPPASRNAYVHVCHFLTFLKKSPEDLPKLLHKNGDRLNTRSHIAVDANNLDRNAGGTTRYKKTMNSETQLGEKLISREQECPPPFDMLKMISQVWVVMLCYAAHRCSAYSHAKQLSNGGELITISALLVEHIRRRTSMP
ncbi:hypothetical protein PR202_gb27410 [Eleusine coracana subsp. coracana]|uniref:DUF4220 domain-containing protein n=1 Tax=Eleusine coracana subsp. coracana TaxID=191504 RepID=A0AAV5FU69_ELECO|nr:hypothetical protein PR202_gb27410 [Eleusine coracana subsp. coracana]